MHTRSLAVHSYQGSSLCVLFWHLLLLSRRPRPVHFWDLSTRFDGDPFDAALAGDARWPPHVEACAGGPAQIARVPVRGACVCERG